MRVANAAILFEPEGYALDSPQLMGRQAAGNAFLRAAVQGRDGGPLYAYTPRQQSAQQFAAQVRGIDPNAEVGWVPADRLDLLSQVGTLYVPGPGLPAAAKLRLRAGVAAYSITGITHTTASHRAMDDIAALLTAPVMPWDALICTSAAVASTVQTVLQAEREYLHWRLGQNLNVTLPHLPVIPLGVHCSDFEFDVGERQLARQVLGIADDEVAVLYVGRLSFHAKAHPHAMYQALQVASEREGKRVVLVQCGWFAGDAVEQSYVGGAQLFCPGVRTLFTDGRDAPLRRQCWASADIFVSLSDNIQETFGLTPIEAMAAGLPVVVSDWNGYKDTVRDGEDGFRIPTWMPPPGLGAHLAKAYEAGIDSYDYYCGLSCQTVSLDGRVLADRLSALIADPALRQRLGQAGQARARHTYGWDVVFRLYRNLWDELGMLRLRAQAVPAAPLLAQAPRQAPARLDPCRSFAHYPTHLLGLDAMVQTAPDANVGAYRALAQHGLFNYAAKLLPAEDVAQRLFTVLSAPQTVAEAARLAQLDPAVALQAISVLSKMGLLHLQRSSPSPA